MYVSVMFSGKIVTRRKLVDELWSLGGFRLNWSLLRLFSVICLVDLIVMHSPHFAFVFV